MYFYVTINRITSYLNYEWTVIPRFLTLIYIDSESLIFSRPVNAVWIQTFLSYQFSVLENTNKPQLRKVPMLVNIPSFRISSGFRGAVQEHLGKLSRLSLSSLHWRRKTHRSVVLKGHVCFIMWSFRGTTIWCLWAAPE